MQKKKQTHRYREQMSVYQWGEEKGKKTRRGKGLKEVKTNTYKIYKLQDYIRLHCTT